MFETCPACAFDGSRWTDQDVTTTAGIMGELWRGYVVGTPDALVDRRPAPDRWSIGEYTRHLAETLELGRQLINTAATQPGTDVGDLARPPLTPQPTSVDLPGELVRLDQAGTALHDQLRTLPWDGWPDARLQVRGAEVDVPWLGRHLCHELMHHLHDVGRIRAQLGDGVAPQSGRVVNLARSDGGVPKDPQPAIEVDVAGAQGDRQSDRKHHGRIFQALCLWSEEQLAALRAEGHPIAAGAAGENITVAGIDWFALRPGALIEVGGAAGALAELSCYATPCAKNAQWFAAGDFKRMDQDLHPGWSRMYATVLRPGRIELGDTFEVEPG